MLWLSDGTINMIAMVSVLLLPHIEPLSVCVVGPYLVPLWSILMAVASMMLVCRCCSYLTVIPSVTAIVGLLLQNNMIHGVECALPTTALGFVSQSGFMNKLACAMEHLTLLIVGLVLGYTSGVGSALWMGIKGVPQAAAMNAVRKTTLTMLLPSFWIAKAFRENDLRALAYSYFTRVLCDIHRCSLKHILIMNSVIIMSFAGHWWLAIAVAVFYSGRMTWGGLACAILLSGIPYSDDSTILSATLGFGSDEDHVLLGMQAAVLIHDTMLRDMAKRRCRRLRFEPDNQDYRNCDRCAWKIPSWIFKILLFVMVINLQITEVRAEPLTGLLLLSLSEAAVSVLTVVVGSACVALTTGLGMALYCFGYTSNPPPQAAGIFMPVLYAIEPWLKDWLTSLLSAGVMTLAECSIILCVISVALLSARRQMDAPTMITVSVMQPILAYQGVQSPLFWVAMASCALNAFAVYCNRTPALPGVCTIMFIQSLGTVIPWLFMRYVPFLNAEVPATWALFVFFGVITLELAPFFATPIIVVRKQALTGKHISTTMEAGPISRLFLGNVSCHWSALTQSSTIEDVVVRSHDRFWTRKHLIAMNPPFENNDVAISHTNSVGYVTMDGKFLATCSAIHHCGTTYVLLNVHTMFDSQGKARNLCAHFPGLAPIPIKPCTAYAGQDLCCASGPGLPPGLRISPRPPTHKAVVMGYNPDGSPYRHVVAVGPSGIAQQQGCPGNSGSIMLNDDGHVCAILWLTGDNHTAQYVSLNPIVMTQASDKVCDVTLKDRDAAASQVDALKLQLRLEREKLHDVLSGPEMLELRNVSECLLKAQHESLEKAAALKELHQFMLELMTRARDLKGIAALAGSVRLRVLSKIRGLVPSTETVAQLKQDLKIARRVLVEIESELQNKMTKPLIESRMPTTTPSVLYPVVYQDASGAWHVMYNKDTDETLDGPPASNDKLVTTIKESLGVNRRTAIRVLTSRLVCEDYATKLKESGLISTVYDYLTGNRLIDCALCGRRFECLENHTHNINCHKTQVMNCEKHTDWCCTNSWDDKEVTINGWKYGIVSGKLALGHPPMCTCMRHGTTPCVVNQRPDKVSKYHIVRKGDEMYYVARDCVEGLFRTFRQIQVVSEQNDALVASLQVQLEQASSEEKGFELADELQQMHDDNEALQQQLDHTADELISTKQALDSLKAKADLTIRSLTQQVDSLTSKLIAKGIWDFDSEVETANKLHEQTTSQKQTVEVPKPQRKQRSAKVTESGVKDKTERKQAAESKPVFPIVNAKPTMHSKWTKETCMCHLCDCTNKCTCPEKMCLWCNCDDHNTLDCKVCWKSCASCEGKGDGCCQGKLKRCVICHGAHHPMRCPVRNRKFPEAQTKQNVDRGATPTFTVDAFTFPPSTTE